MVIPLSTSVFAETTCIQAKNNNPNGARDVEKNGFIAIEACAELEPVFMGIPMHALAFSLLNREFGFFRCEVVHFLHYFPALNRIVVIFLVRASAFGSPMLFSFNIFIIGCG